MALLLDELYSDTIQITKKLKAFMNTLSLGTKETSCFEYFKLDTEFNKKEEHHIMSLKNSSSVRDLSESLYLEEKQMYQTFMVGKREYKIDSENWSVGKFNLPEKKLILETNASVPSLRNNLLTSLISPRASIQKKSDFHKSFTSPIMDLKYYQGISDNQHGMQSARQGTFGLNRDWNSQNGSVTERSEDYGFETPKNEINNHFRSNTLTSWDGQIGSMSARSTATNLASPKKGTFSSLFGRKSKQIMPTFLGRSSFLGSKS